MEMKGQRRQMKELMAVGSPFLRAASSGLFSLAVWLFMQRGEKQSVSLSQLCWLKRLLWVDLQKEV